MATDEKVSSTFETLEALLVLSSTSPKCVLEHAH